MSDRTPGGEADRRAAPTPPSAEPPATARPPARQPVGDNAPPSAAPPAPSPAPPPAEESPGAASGTAAGSPPHAPPAPDPPWERRRSARPAATAAPSDGEAPPWASDVVAARWTPPEVEPEPAGRATPYEPAPAARPVHSEAEPAARAVHSEPAPTAAAPAARPASPPARRRTGGTLLAALTALVIAVAAFLLGGVVLGRSPAAGPGPVAGDAARAWLAATPFTARRAGVPSDLERRGALQGATLQPLGQWHHGSQAGETFAVTAGASTYGLTVVTTHGALAFPPTPGPLPFVVGQAPPAAPDAVDKPPGRLPAPVLRWATSIFGAKGSGAAALGMGLAGTPSAVASWSPRAGGTVYRVRVPLSSLAPGTAAGDEAARYRSLTQKLASDTAASTAAQGAAAQAQAAAQAAAAANAAANPPNPALAAQAAATAATGTAAQQRAQAAGAAVAADQAALAQAPKPPTSAVTAVAIYDVWARAQAVVGWEPAGYGFRG